MNKIATTLMGILAIIFFTGNVYAGTISSAGIGGTAVTVAATSATGAGSQTLSFIPSPGIIMAGDSTATAFTLFSANVKAEANAVGFCMISSTPTIFQSKLTLDADSTSSALPSASGFTTGSAPATGWDQRN